MHTWRWGYRGNLFVHTTTVEKRKWSSEWLRCWYWLQRACSSFATLFLCCFRCSCPLWKSLLAFFDYVLLCYLCRSSESISLTNVKITIFICNDLLLSLLLLLQALRGISKHNLLWMKLMIFFNSDSTIKNSYSLIDYTWKWHYCGIYVTNRLCELILIVFCQLATIVVNYFPRKL